MIKNAVVNKGSSQCFTEPMLTLKPVVFLFIQAALDCFH